MGGGEAPGEGPGLGGSIALSFVSLAVVCLLAYVLLRLIARRGHGRADGPLRVMLRCLIDARHSVVLVEAMGRYLLLGVGEGSVTLIAELRPEEAGCVPSPSRKRPASTGPGREAEQEVT